jgi:hypothetical protein
LDFGIHQDLQSPLLFNGSQILLELLKRLPVLVAVTYKGFGAGHWGIEQRWHPPLPHRSGKLSWQQGIEMTRGSIRAT